MLLAQGPLTTNDSAKMSYDLADLTSLHVISGTSVKIMRKAKLSVHKGDVQSVLRAFSIEVPANSLADLEEVRQCCHDRLTSARYPLADTTAYALL